MKLFIKKGSIENSLAIVPKNYACLKSLNVIEIILFECFQKHSEINNDALHVEGF